MRARRFLLLPVALLFLVLAPPRPAQAQTTRMGVHTGLDLEGSEVLIGLNGQFGVTIADREVLLGLTGELFPFLDGRSRTLVGIDALMPFRVSDLSIYGGGGLLIRMDRIDPPAGQTESDSETDLAAHVKLGFVYGGPMTGTRPFVEVDQSFGPWTTLTVRAGVFFVLGLER